MAMPKASLVFPSSLKVLLLSCITIGFSSDVISGDYCSRLRKQFDNEERHCNVVRAYEHVIDVVVASTSRAPSLATAALLAAALRQRHGYNITRRIDNSNHCQLAATLPDLTSNNLASQKEAFIYVDVDWNMMDKNCPALPTCSDIQDFCGIGGSRLQPMGGAAVLYLKLYSVLNSMMAKNYTCQNANTLHFYRDQSVLKQCGFLSYNKIENSTCIKLFVLNNESIDNQINLDATGLKFCRENVSSRTILKEKIQNKRESFLFIDYDFWGENDTVQIVLLPARMSPPSATASLRLADIKIFRQYAYKILSVLTNFIPTSQDLRGVLERTSTIVDIDEAACAWALSNTDKFKSWSKGSNKILWANVFLCKDDPDYEEYKKLIEKVEKLHGFNLYLRIDPVDCNHTNELANRIADLISPRSWTNLTGIVAAGHGSVAGVSAATNAHIQLVLYDVAPSRTEFNSDARTATGSLKQLANAHRKFFESMNWKRIAIISERSALAEDFTKELTDVGKLITHKIEIDNSSDVRTVMKKFKDMNARIFFVNAGSETAESWICEAFKLGMTAAAGYAWIVREWRPPNCSNEINVFTISYWWRGGDRSWMTNETIHTTLFENLDSLWHSRPWPPLAASLADSLLLLQHGITELIKNDSVQICDIHAYGTRSKFSELLHTKEGAGLLQRLQLNNHTLAKPYIFVYSWRRCNISDLLAVWRAYGDDNITEVRDYKKAYPVYSPPYDGTSHCVTTTTDKSFSPRCHDAVYISCLIIVIVTVIALLLARRIRLRRLQERDKEIHIRLLARCERTATALARYLVDQSALELYEELGSGHFGRVRRGMLRLPGCAPVAVAAKALRKDAAPAEEAEFLREASTLSSLQHAHIVKLVGVCAADGPPLLLMEQAYFGDLLRYLRERWHLAEMHVGDSCEDENICLLDPEANYVSPAELTRMAREAAEALDYLSSKKIVHRDVRAANCLVDSRRALKLADFGMARTVGAQILDIPVEPDSEYKYICMRRGVFPVPWMAPESLERGEFSYASDVWALGVLILELATLGERPFLSMSPPEVLRYVRAGGRPPLPRDVSFHTFEVTELCWHSPPSKRARAADIMVYLHMHPHSVRAALRPAWRGAGGAAPGGGAARGGGAGGDHTDSGFGEREGDAEWPLGLVSTL